MPETTIKYPDWVAYEPDLVPPPELMAQEGIQVLEDWFRWAEEWSMLLRVYAGIARKSAVMEIGCGLGRTAFPLRYILSAEGNYEGFDICKFKIDFLERTFQPAHPNFRFTWADVHNTHYNPGGKVRAVDYRFPYEDQTFDIVFAASVFTHMLPEAVANYFRQSARVLKPGGRCLLSFFLLDNYRPGQARPLGFSRPAFDFDFPFGRFGDDFAISNPGNPEEMAAYRMQFVEQMADQASLEVAHLPLPGFWSGCSETWVGAQDIVLLLKRR